MINFFPTPFIPFFLPFLSPPSCLPIFLLFSMWAQAGRNARSQQVSWHAAPHPLPFVSTSEQPFSTSAVSVNIYWPSFSSSPPLLSVRVCAPVSACGLHVYTHTESFPAHTLTCATSLYPVSGAVTHTSQQCRPVTPSLHSPSSVSLHCSIMLLADSRERKQRRKLLQFSPALSLCLPQQKFMHLREPEGGKPCK